MTQDANFNVLGLVNRAGVLRERYEYAPYGRRTVYGHGWLLADKHGTRKGSSRSR